MIFGFNTDIKQDEATYHVQSEARVSEQLLQTQVFVQGRCIAKRAVSYAELTADPAFTEEVMHERLRQQHRWVVEAIRDGYIDELVRGAEDSPAEGTPEANTPKAEPVAEQKTLELRFVSSARPTADSIVLNFEVNIGGEAATGVTVHATLSAASEESSGIGTGSTSGLTDTEGKVELKLPVVPGAHGEAKLMVKATHETASHGTLKAAKVFRIRAASSK